MPLLLLVPVFVLVAWTQWEPRRGLGQVLVAVATLFAFYGLAFPGASAQDLADGRHVGVAVLITLGRATGLAAVLAAVALALRDRRVE